MWFVTQFVNPLLPRIRDVLRRSRPQLRSIGLVIYEISEFAAELL
jgi:hypothetical protein